MSVEDFSEAQDLIEIFFSNGAMDYTDAAKFLHSVGRLQASVNIEQSANLAGANQFINRLFTLMRDRAITAQAEKIIEGNERRENFRTAFQEFIIDVTEKDGGKPDQAEIENRIIASFDKVGIDNAALYLFEKRVLFDENNDDLFPDWIRLRCVIKEGELYIIPKERQDGLTDLLFQRMELPPKCRECLVLPLIYKTSIYGFIVTQMTKEIASSGEFIASQIGRLLYEGEI